MKCLLNLFAMQLFAQDEERDVSWELGNIKSIGNSHRSFLCTICMFSIFLPETPHRPTCLYGRGISKIDWNNRFPHFRCSTSTDICSDFCTSLLLFYREIRSNDSNSLLNKSIFVSPSAEPNFQMKIPPFLLCRLDPMPRYSRQVISTDLVSPEIQRR